MRPPIQNTSKSSSEIGTFLSVAGRRERRIPRDELDLRLDVLVGGIDIQRRGVDRLIDGEYHFVVSDDVISVLNGMPGKAPASTWPSQTA